MPTKIHESFAPLAEKAVRKDGTIGIKLIASGWGSSGFYPRDVLERDIPQVFPPGTHMYWNHDTITEEGERPEGDLNRLAAVITTIPIWQDGGAEGPGMYADARVFKGYAETVDDIAEHIGVSIRGAGMSEIGKAEGREGPIIQEITMGKSIDFVTKPGAGGKIVQIFEAARNSEPIQEAQNLGEWLESRLHLRLTELGDDLYGNGSVNREERKAMSAAIGAALDAYRTSLMENVPQLFKRPPWRDAPDSADIPGELDETETNESAQPNAATNQTEVNMDELEKAKNALAEATKTISEQQAAIEEQNASVAKMREMLLDSEARDFVAKQLAESGLPAVTQTRITRECLRDIPVGDNGKIDEKAYAELINGAVTEAQNEIAAITGKNATISGMGSQPAANGNGQQAPDLAESQKRIDAALAGLGYGGN